MSDGSEISLGLEGHLRCRQLGCETQVPVFVGHMTTGLCFDCFVNGPMARLKEIEVLHRSTRVAIKLPESKNKRKNRKKTNNGSLTHSHKVTRAKDAARKRLVMLYPEVYDLLYAEERHKAGLMPVPRRDPNCYIEAIKTYGGGAEYDPLRTVGVTHDGA